jgi:hypothetical protein
MAGGDRSAGRARRCARGVNSTPQPDRKPVASAAGPRLRCRRPTPSRTAGPSPSRWPSRGPSSSASPPEVGEVRRPSTARPTRTGSTPHGSGSPAPRHGCASTSCCAPGPRSTSRSAGRTATRSGRRWPLPVPGLGRRPASRRPVGRRAVPRDAGCAAARRPRTPAAAARRADQQPRLRVVRRAGLGARVLPGRPGRGQPRLGVPRRHRGRPGGRPRGHRSSGIASHSAQLRSRPM